MISRKEQKSFQNNRKMVAFGQFVLPLAVVVAVALLFFSVKLFFYSPGPKNENVQKVSPQNSAESLKKEKDNQAKNNKDKQISVTVKSEMLSSSQESEKVNIEPARPAVKQGAEPTIAKASKQNTVSKQKPAPQQKKLVAPVKKTQSSVSKNNNVKPTKPQTRKQSATGPTKAEPVTKKPEQKSPAQTKPAVSSPAEKDVLRWDIQVGGFADKNNSLQLLESVRGRGYSAYLVESKMNGAPFWKVRVKGVKDKAEASKTAEELKGKGYPVFLTEIN